MTALLAIAVCVSVAPTPWPLESSKVLARFPRPEHCTTWGTPASVSEEGTKVVRARIVADSLANVQIVDTSTGSLQTWDYFYLLASTKRDRFAAAFQPKGATAKESLDYSVIRSILRSSPDHLIPEGASYLSSPLISHKDHFYAIWSTSYDDPDPIMAQKPALHRQGIIRVDLRSPGAKSQRVLFTMPYGPSIAWFDPARSLVAINWPKMGKKKPVAPTATSRLRYLDSSTTRVYRIVDGKLIELRDGKILGLLGRLIQKRMPKRLVSRVSDNLKHALLCDRPNVPTDPVNWLGVTHGNYRRNNWEMNVSSGESMLLPHPDQQTSRYLNYVRGRLFAFDPLTKGYQGRWYVWDRKARKWLSGGNSRLVGFSASGKYLLLYADGKMQLVQPKWSAWPGG